MSSLSKTVFTLFAASALAACSSSSDFGGDGAEGTGMMSLAVTDAPADEVDRVQITFDRVELQPQGGQRVVIELDEAVTIENMLALQGNVSAPIFESFEVPAGPYNFIRLFIVGGAPDSFVDDAEGRFGLFVPGNQPPSQNPNQRFLQLSSPFVVPAGGAADFTIDVELRDALVSRKNQTQPHYMLRPSLRLVDNAEVGDLTGTIDPLVATSEDCFDAASAETTAAVYIYAGADAAPGDVCTSDNEAACPDDVDRPLTSAVVGTAEEMTLFTYTVGFLLAGDYTAALTCDSRNDDPESDDRDTVGFKAQKNFTITAGATTEVNFDDSDIVVEVPEEENDESEEDEEVQE